MWNMDEALLWLDMPMKNTIETKGRRCITYLNTGKERKQISVVLCATEYGHKLQCTGSLLTSNSCIAWQFANAAPLYGSVVSMLPEICIMLQVSL
jgi:hypothetical protein